MTKILIALGILLAILTVLVILGRKSVHHEILIEATPETVWNVLTDTDNYDSWNPVMKLLEGEIKEGNQVLYQFTQDPDNIIEMPSTVKQIVPQKLLNQGGGPPLILTFDHRYILESQGSGTKLTIHEDYAGIGVNFWNPAPVEAAYGRLNEAIKARAESR